MDLPEACPLDTIRLTGQQHDILQRNLPFQAVMVVESIAVLIRIQQFEFFRLRLNSGFLEQFPRDSLTAGFSCLHSAAGIFPCSSKALPLRPSGQ